MSDYPANWIQTRLGDMAEVRYGKAKPAQEGNIPVVGSSGVYASTCTALIDYPTLIVGRKGTAGKVWLQEEPCWPADTTFYLEWKKCNADLLFLYYAMTARPLSGEHARTTMPSLQKPDLEDYAVWLPPLPEQRAIAATLRAVQDTREARRRELALERERKAALMEDLFTCGTRGEPCKQTEIGPMPQSWEVVLLDSVAQVSSGGTPDRKNSAYWNGEIPWVKTGEINYNIIHDTDEKITEEGLRNSSTRIIPAGTLLLAMYGQGVTRGRVAILGIDASINQACAALCFNSQKVETRFIFYYLSKAYDAIRNLGHGANQTNLNATHIKSIPLPLPSLDEQHAVADALTACDQKIAALEAEAALHDELFRALLEELMTGRISTLPLVAAME